ncbi:DMT family transporter [Azospirillum rugosum]|uniref:Drug/metabolite transporter (DMT)-like permease n=1 Tax=Azospirillum rugosum TaxID=416170 RepID=A0ABS4SKQ1_9PROT|nr:DMT family transporter [Azospirillum rugosum]MBP2293075.1 drug/metabolite transporter (DMT)-like permease [Azospirillum rugosum]MDQ0526624.1 drug/metabolite transporter (DMT)-like permease [Azospirillum rugosum]
MADQAVPSSAQGRRPEVTGPGAVVYMQLAGIVLFWGANWPLMKTALSDIGPLTFCAIRLVGAAAVLAVLSRLLKFPLLPKRGERWPLALVGLLQVAAMMDFSAVGLRVVPPGRASVLAYTMQMWALPLGVLLAGERFTGQRVAGALLAFGGVLVFFNPALVDWSDGAALVGNGLLLTCAFCWALGATLYRRRAGGWRTPFWTQTFWQIAVSGLATAPLALAAENARPIHWTPALGTVLAFNWLVATGLCYWWWSKSLTAMPAAQAGQIVCLVPITALVLSALFMGEPLSVGVLAAVALIGAGIVTTMRAPR